MNLPEKPSTDCELQSPNTHHSESRSKWRPAVGIAIFLALAGIILCRPIGSPVLAKAALQTNDTSAVDPDAIEALNKMGTYLRSLNAFQVEAEIHTDGVLDDGQIIQSTRTVDMLAVKPDRLRTEIKGDGVHRIYFFDGKNFTVYGQLVNYYATVPAPATTRELIARLDEKYGLELPLIDLFKWGTDAADPKRITSAIDVGPATINGTTCEQYAFRQPGLDWQIWIQLGDYPLPRKFVIRTLSDEARPQHSDELTWNLGPSYSDNAFTFDPPPDAHRIVLAEVKPDNDKKN